MISSFRGYNDNGNKVTDFMKKLREDIAELDDGSYLYAFLEGNDEYGTNGKYLKLKIVKEDDQFLGFIIKNTADDGTVAGKLIQADIFKPSRDKENAVGYCINEQDAELVKAIRAKMVIDKYCLYVGFDDLENFIKEFKRFQDVFPEKLI